VNGVDLLVTVILLVALAILIYLGERLFVARWPDPLADDQEAP
jgi:hypothetical protein